MDKEVGGAIELAGRLLHLLLPFALPACPPHPHPHPPNHPLTVQSLPAAAATCLPACLCVLQGPRMWYKVMREIVTLERMHRAFDDGLMEVGGRPGCHAQRECC